MEVRDSSLENLRREVGDTLLKRENVRRMTTLGLRVEGSQSKNGGKGYLVEEEKGEEEDEAHRYLLAEDSQRQACLCDGEPAGVVTGVWHVGWGRTRRVISD
jgi:hypothetical protein